MFYDVRDVNNALLTFNDVMIPAMFISGLVRVMLSRCWERRADAAIRDRGYLHK